MRAARAEQVTVEARQERAAAWFRTLRDRFCAAFEALEDAHEGGSGAPGRFERTIWKRPTEDGGDGGGGEMSIMKGRVFEKVGVNFSAVHGAFSPEFRDRIPGAADDPRFWASGISVVAHLCSPLVPAMHMNTRFIVTTKAWFGGGGDLTPIYPDADAAAAFHAALKAACDAYDPPVTPGSGRRATGISSCPTATSPAAPAESSTTIWTAATGRPISRSPGAWAAPFWKPIPRSSASAWRRPGRRNSAPISSSAGDAMSSSTCSTTGEPSSGSGPGAMWKRS